MLLEIADPQKCTIIAGVMTGKRWSGRRILALWFSRFGVCFAQISVSAANQSIGSRRREIKSVFLVFSFLGCVLCFKVLFSVAFWVSEFSSHVGPVDSIMILISVGVGSRAWSVACGVWRSC